MDQQFPSALSFDDVLLVPNYSEIESRSDVDLTTKISEKISLKIPLISANVDTITGVAMAIAIGKMGGFGMLPRFTKPEKQANNVSEVKKANVLAAASIGIKKAEDERAEMLVKAGVDILNIDVAHGHMKSSIEATKKIKQKFGSSITLISGIVATKEAAEAHFQTGADCIASGVGSGSICTTRIQTGCGVPGFTSLLDIAPIARKYKKSLIPIAGIKNSGDIVKSLAAGASAVWGGYIFSGTNEAPGDIIEIDNSKYKRYNGSTSKIEKAKHVQRYKFERTKTYSIHVEGIESLVPYRGPVNKVVQKLLAGIRSGFSYSGARNIEELWEKARFIRITSSGIKESMSHDVILNDGK
jgi:IMP dehydrogenase